MANVISELFKDIADSIRYKTGGTGTMKPAEFPAEIMSIVTGGGSGGSGGESGGGSGSTDVRETWLFDNGEFKPEEYQVEINHSLGKVPDIVFLKINASEPLKGSVTFLTNVFSMSESLLGGSTNIGSVPRQYYGFSIIYNASSHAFTSISANSIEMQASAATKNTIYITDKILRFGDPELGRLQKAYTYYWGAYARTTTSSGGGGGSGESSDLIKHVTFIGEDGTQLYRMPVLTGDNCKDPVANGNIATPTKESTVDTVYTFSGWSLTQGGNANSAALSNVTEDRMVYVAFKASARTYTVRFYDGDTLVKTQQVAYGG